jgi:hypothetical protein
MTRLACFVRLCRAIKRKCQAHCGPELALVSQLAEESEILPLGRTRIPFACFALLKNPAIDWTPPQKKRLGFGGVVTKVPPGTRSGPQLTKELLPTASMIISKRSKLAKKSLPL